MLDNLFELFIKEKQYIQNCSPNTIRYYRQSYHKVYRKFLDDDLPNKEKLSQLVYTMRDEGISPGSCNTYIRALNSFITWLNENEHVKGLGKIKQMKLEKKVGKTFTDDELKRIISYRPKFAGECRLHTLLYLLIDTGIRIEEGLGMRRVWVDYENLLIKVKGKGNKERIIPISVELRRMLYNFSKSHNFDLLFANREGRKITFQNACRDAHRLYRKLGIEPRGFHCLRRTFAKNYVRNGGNVFYLQKAMGHEKLETTRIYVEVETEALQETHLKTSLLSRLK